MHISPSNFLFERKILTLEAMIFFKKTSEIKAFISIWYQHKCLIQLFLIHLNTYVMGLRPLVIFNSYSARIDFGRQNLASIDFRFWWLKGWENIYNAWNTCILRVLYQIRSLLFTITLTTLKYFCKKYGDQRTFFLIWNNIINVLLLHLNSYVMGLRPL